MSNFENIHQEWPNASEGDKKIIQYVHDLDLKFRGAFLIQANWIETEIDSFLALIFCEKNKKNSNLLKSTLLKRITFDGKISSLIKVIKLRFPKLSETSPNKKSPVENLEKNLNTIRKFRNKLSHSHLSITDVFIKKNLKDRIPILSYEDGEEKFEEIMVKDVENKLVTASEILQVLENLNKQLIFKFS